MLSFTNKACNVVRKRFQDKDLDTGFIHTLCSYIYDDKINIHNLIEKISKLDVIWIDETSMCPMKYYNIIYLAWLTKKIHGGDLKIILSGDVYQIPSIETIEKRYDITKCKAIKQMCPTLIN